jgi:hypothetical protein
MPELLEKDAKKKRHIEYGRHFEFLIKKIFYQNKIFRQPISKKKIYKKDDL